MIPKKFKYKLFGRFKGRKKLKSSLSSKFKNYQINFDKDFKTKKKIILDIGSGSGENSIYLSKLYPKSLIIACDLYEDGNINLIEKILEDNIINIKFFQGNIIEFLDLLDSPQLFTEVWILFPDPWPKKRHHKRRLINYKFLEKIYNYIVLFIHRK